MGSPECLAWVERQLGESEVRGRRVLEVGAYDVNGSVRPAIERHGPREYIGADMRPGPGVDSVCPAEGLVARFGRASFDIVVTVCTFEHIRRWQAALTQIKQVCRPGGLILFIAPARWPFHAYPGDYWRFEPEDVAALFADSALLSLEVDPTPRALTYAKVRRLAGGAELDLTAYPLYSVVTGRRTAALRRADFFTAYFAGIVLAYWVTRLPPPLARAIVVVAAGVRLRILRPLRAAALAAIGRVFLF